MSSISISDALFTKTQQKVLGLLYSKPDQRFYTNEILRWAAMGRGSVRRELERMTNAGLIQLSREGNQHYYQANAECPVYQELLGLVRKTFGIADVIKAALSPLSDKIESAFIFGSLASGKATSGSDIDLMVIGEISYTEVVSVLYSAQELLRREINPKIYTAMEWEKMLMDKDSFIKEVYSKPRMDVIGTSNES